MHKVDEPTRQEGFLVFQESGIANHREFCSTLEGAEKRAKSLLQNGEATIIVEAVRITTGRVEALKRGDLL